MMTPSDGLDADRICAYCNLKMILLAQRASRTVARKTSEKGVHCSEVARDGKAVPRSSPRACVAARLKGRQRRTLARGAHQSAAHLTAVSIRVEAGFGDDLKIDRLSAHRR